MLRNSAKIDMKFRETTLGEMLYYFQTNCQQLYPPDNTGGPPMLTLSMPDSESISFDSRF